MSHTSIYSREIKDPNLLCDVAKKLSYETIESDCLVKLWNGEVTAIASIKIKGWRYPIAISSQGQILYDHFGSEANTMEKLGEMIQEYNRQIIIKNMPEEVLYFSGAENEKTKDYIFTLEFD